MPYVPASNGCSQPTKPAPKWAALTPASHRSKSHNHRAEVLVPPCYPLSPHKPQLLSVGSEDGYLRNRSPARLICARSRNRRLSASSGIATYRYGDTVAMCLRGTLNGPSRKNARYSATSPSSSFSLPAGARVKISKARASSRSNGRGWIAKRGRAHSQSSLPSQQRSHAECDRCRPGKDGFFRTSRTYKSTQRACRNRPRCLPPESMGVL